MRWGALALALLFSVPSEAQEVDVRGGEHIGFSRLLLEFQKRPQWWIERIEDGLAVRNR